MRLTKSFTHSQLHVLLTSTKRNVLKNGVKLTNIVLVDSRHKLSNQLAKSCRNSSSRSVSNLLLTAFFSLHRLLDFVTIISIFVSFALSASFCSYLLSATYCE